jgi:hypothetical protein
VSGVVTERDALVQALRNALTGLEAAQSAALSGRALSETELLFIAETANAARRLIKAEAHES